MSSRPYRETVIKLNIRAIGTTLVDKITAHPHAVPLGVFYRRVLVFVQAKSELNVRNLWLIKTKFKFTMELILCPIVVCLMEMVECQSHVFIEIDNLSDSI